MIFKRQYLFSRRTTEGILCKVSNYLVPTASVWFGEGKNYDYTCNWSTLTKIGYPAAKTDPISTTWIIDTHYSCYILCHIISPHNFFDYLIDIEIIQQTFFGFPSCVFTDFWKSREYFCILHNYSRLNTLITLLRIPILRPNRQYKASTAKMA